VALGHKKNDPHARLGALERWSARATLFILAGIVLDMVLVFAFTQGSWERAGAIVANALIGIGLIVEYVVIGRAIVAGGEAQRLSDERVAAAEARAAEANARAAEANQKAEEERLARVKFESERAWRSLTREQHEEMAAALRKFTGQKFHMLTYREDRECDRFAYQIVMTLELAGWSQDSHSTDPMGLDERVIELAISDDAMLEPSYALVDALRAAGHDCAVVGNPHVQPNVIEIRIGRKPERAKF
jgi:hypothetical protein